MRSQLMLRAYLLLMSLLPMAAMAIYVVRFLPVTNPYVYYAINSEKQSLTWSLGPSHFAMAHNSTGTSRSATLDLSTGRQSTLPYAFYQVLDERPDGTVTIQQFKATGPGIDIAQWSPDAKTSRILWRVDRLLPVLNHRYLLSSQDNRFVAYDLNHTGSQRPDAIDICLDPQRVSTDELQCLDGTNNLLVSRSLGPNSVAIYSLHDGQATEVTNWKTGGMDGRAVIRQGHIYSLSQDGKSLEVRECQQFQLVDRLPLPANLIGQWSGATCSQTLVTIQNLQTAAYESYRLQDLSPIPELNDWAPYRLKYNQIFHHRYQIFNPPDNSRRRLLVYDGLSHKIALEHDTDHDYVEAEVVGDDKLAITDYRCGLTCTVIDLTTGKPIATYRPLFWPLLCTLVLNGMAIVWVISWLRFSAQTRISMFVDWFVLGAVIAAPMLYRSWTTTWMAPQPSMNLFHAFWLACMMAASYNLWFGRSRIVLRLCVCLMALVASAGLLQLREWVHWTSSPTAIAAVWVHFLSITLLSIVTIRLVTLPKLGAIDLSSDHRPANEQEQNVQLLDLFTLTAVSAFLVGSVLPMKVHLKSAINLLGYSWPLSVISIVALTTASGLFFSRLRIAGRLRILLVAVAILLVIGEWAIKLIDFRLLIEARGFVYSIELAGLASVCFLVASAWTWRVRQELSS